MRSEKRSKDIMVSIFDFPHIPYWFSISQAIKIIKVSFLDTKEYPDPLALLVFDEKYNLMGTLTLQDILRGLDPRFLRPAEKARDAETDQSTVSLLWDSLFTQQTKTLAEKPVSEIMVPTRFFVEPDDPIAKAAYLMVMHNLILLPVLENKKKLVGLVRMRQIFSEISEVVLTE